MSDPSGKPPGGAGGGANILPIARLLGGEQNAGLIQNIITVLGFMSLSVEVFLRRDFGERYLSVLRFILAWIIFSFFTLGGQVLASIPLLGRAVAASAAREAAAGFWFFQVLYWGFVVLGFYHLWRIFSRNRKGERWFSFSFGISHFNGLAGLKIGPFTIDDWALFRFIEPLFIFVLAFVAGRLSGAASGWLWLAGFTLLIKNNYLYAQERGRILDMMDGQIKQDFYRDALKGEDKRKTAGFTMVRPPVALDRNGDGIPDLLQIEGQRPAAPPDFGDVLTDTLGDRPIDLSSPRRELDTPAPRQDFGDVLSETFGEPRAPTRPPEEGQEDTRPFDAAIPLTARSGMAPATATPREESRSAPAPAPTLLSRYAPLGAFALLLVVLAVFALVSPRELEAEVPAAPTARPGAAVGTAAPGIVPTADNVARPIPTSNGTPQGTGFQVPRAATTAQSVGVGTAPRPTAIAAIADAPTEEIVPEGDATAVAGQERRYSVAAQEPQSTLRVLLVLQTETETVLLVEYVPTDARKVGVEAPGGPNAFYLQSGGQKYALTNAGGITVGSTTQSVTVGQPFPFTLEFERLPDISQPFDLIEGEHSATESASYWDIRGIRLKDAP